MVLKYAEVIARSCKARALILNTAAGARELKRRGERPLRLAGRNIAVVFLKPSSRTRAAFVVAAAALSLAPRGPAARTIDAPSAAARSHVASLLPPSLTMISAAPAARVERTAAWTCASSLSAGMMTATLASDIAGDGNIAMFAATFLPADVPRGWDAQKLRSP
jgi:hypothetical protein